MVEKDFGGLDIPDLVNLCMLSSWISRYHLSDNVLCKQIIDEKYVRNRPNLFRCSNTKTSPFWKGMLFFFLETRLSGL
jgi:hypothetical protein